MKKQIFYSKNGYPFTAPILKKSQGRYYLEYYISDRSKQLNKRKRFYKISGKTESQIRKNAEFHSQQIMKILMEGKIFETTHAQKKTFPLSYHIGQFLELKNHQAVTATYYTYKSILSQFSLFIQSELNDPAPDFVSKFHIINFRDHLIKKGLSENTVNHYLSNLRSFFNYMTERGFIEDNPALIKIQKAVPQTLRIFTEEEYKILDDYLFSHNQGLHLFTKIIYYSFIRPVEICRLQIKDIDLTNHVIRVVSQKTKNKKNIPVIIPDPLHNLLTAQNIHLYSRDNFLFSKGFKIGPKGIARQTATVHHRRAIDAAGLPTDLKLYAHKHTGNYRAYKAGIDVYTLMKQNRHHSLDMTMQYLRSLGLEINPDLLKGEW